MKFIFNILFLISLIYIPVEVLAGEIYLSSPETLKDYESFNVDVFLDTKGVIINSFELKIRYQSELLDFMGYQDKNSIKKMWIIPPKAQNGFVVFSGIIPGGVQGIYDSDYKELRPINISSLLFKPKSDGLANFEIVDSKILINDGIGNELNTISKNSKVFIKIEDFDKIKATDSTPPKEFNIKFIESSIFSKTPSMIVFETFDENGIEKYQIYERKGKWKDVTSPWPVRQGLLSKAVSVRAVDYYGNSKESVIEIPGLPVKDHVIIGLFIFIACYLVFFVVKIRR